MEKTQFQVIRDAADEIFEFIRSSGLSPLKQTKLDFLASTIKKAADNAEFWAKCQIEISQHKG